MTFDNFIISYWVGGGDLGRRAIEPSFLQPYQKYISAITYSEAVAP
jgi:hypothetical protein